ncbi:response regulator [Candidatus Woesearchaeota archaeon]|nr:response regulator [Candidatus Woesearchaeota archaeon]
MSGGNARHRILMLDDNIDLLTTNEMLLEMAGYEPVIAHNPSMVSSMHEVERLVYTVKPAMVLTDLSMVTLTGTDVLQMCSAEHPYVTRALMSDQDPPNSRAQFFLQKPFDSDQLIKCAGEAVMTYNAWAGAEVLIVDDEPHMLLALKDALSCVPYKVLTAANGKEALSMVHDNLAAVLTDTQMPGMDGRDLLRAVLELQPHAARILMSARPREPEKYINLFMEKPFSVDRAKRVLDAAVWKYVSAR